MSCEIAGLKHNEEHIRKDVLIALDEVLSICLGLCYLRFKANKTNELYFFMIFFVKFFAKIIYFFKIFYK